ncbi:MAG TPA: hypothetical protein VGK73_16775 [Polyangiaceae bacterium]
MLNRVRSTKCWEERSALEAALPVVLGKRYADGRLEGTSLEVGDASTALEILGNSDETLDGELRRQLLVAKLNGARGALLGENITGALVYGTTRTVRETLRAADAAVAGVDLLRDQAKGSGRMIPSSSVCTVRMAEFTTCKPTALYTRQRERGTACCGSSFRLADDFPNARRVSEARSARASRQAQRAARPASLC